MVRRVKDTWSDDRVETEKQAIQALASVHLLILDEVGVQFGSPFEENLMFDVLNSRYENRLPTILISNLTSEKAATFLGERVVDRLREDGGSVVVFDWQSHRRVQ
jgi:DNA replication protein DnaC